MLLFGFCVFVLYGRGMGGSDWDGGIGGLSEGWFYSA